MEFTNGPPNAVLTGQKSMGGVGLTTTDCEQTVEKILTVIRQVQATTSVGKQFQITLEWAQLQAG
eukprot:6374986-Ditylum_brightwellii.AAC.1